MKVGYPDTMNSAAAVSPLKATEPSEAYKKLQAENKAASDRQEAFEKAIREKQSNSNTSRSGSTEPKKKTKLGRAIAARKKRRNDGENDNTKAKEREKGRITRKANKKQNKLDIKKQKARVTKARQDKRTAKATTRQTERLNKVTKKVGEKIEDVNKGTGLGISKNNPGVGNIVKDIVRKKNERSPAQYAETPVNMKTPVKARSRKSGDINYKKADRLNKRVDRLDKKLKKSGVKKTEGGHYTGNAGYTGDSRREIRLRKQDRKAGAAAGYGNMDEAKSVAKLDKTLAKKGYKRIPIKKKKK